MKIIEANKENSDAVKKFRELLGQKPIKLGLLYDPYKLFIENGEEVIEEKPKVRIEGNGKEGRKK